MRLPKTSLPVPAEDAFKQAAEGIRTTSKEVQVDLPNDKDISTSGFTATSALDFLHPQARFDGDGRQVDVPRMDPEDLAEAFGEGQKKRPGLSTLARLFRLPRFELRKAPARTGTYVSLSIMLAVAFISLIAIGLMLERQRSGLLERDLVAARGSMAALQARLEPAAAEQAAAAKDRQAAEASLAETRRALEEERQRSGLLERDLVAAHGSMAALQARLEPAAAEQAAAAKDRQAAEPSLPETRIPVPTPAPRAEPREIRKVKVRKPSRSFRNTTIVLPAALLPTRSPDS